MAYGMRISDWSSDVCSSDLTTAAPGFSDVPGERELITRFTAVWEPFDGFKQTFKASVNSNHTNNPAWNGVIAACATGKSFLDRVTPCKRDFVISQNQMLVNIAASFPLADKDGDKYHRSSSKNLNRTSEPTTNKINVTIIHKYTRNYKQIELNTHKQ